MNAFILLIPFLLIRFVLLGYLNKEAVGRVAYFAPMFKNEKWAYWIYQITNVFIFIYLCFVTIKVDYTWYFYVGMICYILGLLLCAWTIITFSKPSNTQLHTKGLYQFSRNPMYLSYFICFIGCAIVTQSIVLLVIVLLFQISSHWIILAEERWCKNQFGEKYKQYLKKVRRYI